jgi:Ca2+-binding RTX toxin-like protein
VGLSIGHDDPITIVMEAGSSETKLDLTWYDHAEPASSFLVSYLPRQGALLLGASAVNLYQLLDQSQLNALTYTASLSAGFYELQFGALTDGGDFLGPRNFVLAVMAARNSTYVGSAGSDRLDGGAGNDAIDGRAGADLMIGGSGNDSFRVDNSSDRVNDTSGTDSIISSVTYSLTDAVRVVGDIENLTLTGSATLGIGNAADNVLKGNGLDNQLRGMNGDDHLHGFGGIDTLIGGKGNDVFVFDSTANSTTNRDFIADFSNVAGNNDAFLLENTFFTSLAAGPLSAANFKLGTKAADANDYIVYNKTTGALSYDIDGNGASTAIHFATLHNRAAITASDFVVI